MVDKKSFQEREKELQGLTATPAGREEVQHLASRYSAASGELKPKGKSAVTFILVYERVHGIIAI